MYEAETISVMPEAPSSDQTVLKAEKDFEDQSVHDDKKQSRLYNSEGFSKEKQYDIPLQNQEEPSKGLILGVKDPLDEQVYSSSEESDETIFIDQGNLHDGHEFLFIDVNMENQEEALQTSSTEQFSKTQGKVSPMIGDDNKVETLVTPKNGVQNFGKKDNQNWIIKTFFTLQPFPLMKILCSKDLETLNANRVPIFKDFLSFVEQKHLRQIYYRLHQNEVKIKELQTRVDNLCSLLDKNLKFLRSEIVPHLKKEAKVNKKAEHLTPQQVVAITNSFIDGTSHTSSIKRTFQYEDPYQPRCCQCNTLRHVARSCCDFRPYKGHHRPHYL